MVARIYQPAKTAMQSGRAKTHKWILEFEPQTRRVADPLMGWTSSDDTKAQLKLQFSTKEEAISYAQMHGLQYVVQEPHTRRLMPKSYADNFRFDKIHASTYKNSTSGDK